MAHQFKAGQRVRCLNNEQAKQWVTVGKVYEVEYDSDAHLIKIKKSDLGDPAYLSGTQWELAVPLTKASRELAAAQAKVDALKAKAESAAKKAAEAKAKRERNAKLKGLSKAGKRVAEMLIARPSAYGCNRADVIALVSALTGDDLAKAVG